MFYELSTIAPTLSPLSCLCQVFYHHTGSQDGSIHLMLHLLPGILHVLAFLTEKKQTVMSGSLMQVQWTIVKVVCVGQSFSCISMLFFPLYLKTEASQKERLAFKTGKMT